MRSSHIINEKSRSPYIRKTFIWRYLFFFFLGIVLMAGGAWVFPFIPKSSNAKTAILTNTTTNKKEIRTISQLLALSDKELEKVDIGLMNLICAEGLKGSEDLDIDPLLSR